MNKCTGRRFLDGFCNRSRRILIFILALPSCRKKINAFWWIHFCNKNSNEKVLMRKAVISKIVILSDSITTTQAMSWLNNSRTTETHELISLHNGGKIIALQWISSYCEISGNETTANLLPRKRSLIDYHQHISHVNFTSNKLHIQHSMQIQIDARMKTAANNEKWQNQQENLKIIPDLPCKIAVAKFRLYNWIWLSCQTPAPNEHSFFANMHLCVTKKKKMDEHLAVYLGILRSTENRPWAPSTGEQDC